MKNSNTPLMKSGRLPLNHPIVQTIINDRIAQQELEAAQRFWEAAPKRRAYFYEKLVNLIHRTLHHITIVQTDKNRTTVENLKTVQKELFILTAVNQHMVTEYISLESLKKLLTDY